MEATGVNIVDALFDSNVIIDILKNQHRAIAWLNTVQHWHVGISAITWMEVIVGTNDKADLRRLMGQLQQYRVFEVTETDSQWARQQVAIFRLSHGIGITDCLIAAAAARTGLPFYTRNLKHYAPLPGGNAICPY